MPLRGVDGDAKVVSNFLVGPAAGGQHRESELCRRQVVRYLLARHGVVDATPPSRKSVGDFYDALELVWPLRLDDRLEHTPEQPVMFAEALD